MALPTQVLEHVFEQFVPPPLNLGKSFFHAARTDFLESYSPKPSSKKTYSTTRSAFISDSELLSLHHLTYVYVQDINDELQTLEARVEVLTKAKDSLKEARTRLEELVSIPILPLPDLPVDIVHYIFCLFASESVSQAKVLSSVSREVQTWVDPYVWRSMSLVSSRDFKALINASRTRVPDRIFRMSQELTAITCQFFKPHWPFPLLFSSLQSLRSLCLYRTPSIRDVNVTIPTLRRIHLEEITSKSHNAFSSALFKHITRLSVSDVVSRVEWDTLKNIPCLKELILHTVGSEKMANEGITYVYSRYCRETLDFLSASLVHSVPVTLALILWALPPRMLRYLSSSSDPKPFTDLVDGTIDIRIVAALSGETETESIPANILVHPYSHMLDWLEGGICQKGILMVEQRRMRLNDGGSQRAKYEETN
ncbi:hypothetical protein DL96DRAFT_1809894 [Flagelloscypha sp. PMI_526]|nr:hypothetical protein DL96DRAFT_1809894 [Flagelloscypha sp. PMI_526]